MEANVFSNEDVHGNYIINDTTPFNSIQIHHRNALSIMEFDQLIKNKTERLEDKSQ